MPSPQAYNEMNDWVNIIGEYKKSAIINIKEYMDTKPPMIESTKEIISNYSISVSLTK
jgi:hypothetical protein